jgi:hypothetical protein
MAETDNNSPPTPIAKKTNWRALWDIFCESAKIKALGAQLWEEKWFAVWFAIKAPISSLLVIFALVFLIWRGCEKDGNINALQVDKIKLQDYVAHLQNASATNNGVFEHYRLENASLSRELAKLNRELITATQERDQARLLEQSAKSSLGQWILLANSGNTNTPLTERLDILASRISDIPKALNDAVTEFIEEKPRFEVSVNGAILTSHGFVQTDKARALNIVARNIGRTSADRMGIDFFGIIESTNVIPSLGWATGVRRFVEQTNIIVWSSICEYPIPPGSSLTAPLISISTNFTKRSIDARIDVYSSTSGKMAIPFRLLVVP